MFFIVCDGLVKGSGNDDSTPNLVKSLLDMHPGFEDVDKNDPRSNARTEPKEYIAIADGSKRRNAAQVYPGYFRFLGRSVPTVVVVKCGTDEERASGAAKPGNRGKRDSQLVLMNVLRSAFFNERMSPLEYDIFEKANLVMRTVNEVPPLDKATNFYLSNFEIVLMVDADTRVDGESLSRMVTAMQQDPTVMGLCGETKISNKRTSWVTRIQVFEYYVSHHLGKAFESVFGGVTCLPGCFCMYRIKAPKLVDNKVLWVPILANPDIIEEYSENVVVTLHAKNLLFLGEDRFLSTLMLRSFPSRKM